MRSPTRAWSLLLRRTRRSRRPASPRAATSPVLQHDDVGAQLGDAIELVRHDDDGKPAARELADAAEGALLKAHVADGEHLVDDQDIGLEMRGDGEAEARVHAARVALDRRVDELGDAGELDDLVEAARDVARCASP